jgi:membrane protein DedA with SNARE-associated domain
MNLLHTASRLIWEFYRAHRYGALFFLVLVEEAGVPIPIPGDTLVMLAGLEHHKTVPYAAAVIGFSSLAVFIGSSLLFLLARRGGRPVLEKYGKYLHLNQHRLDRIERWVARRGRVALVFGRLTPGLRMPTTVMAGLSGVPYSVYAPTAAVAALFWSAFYFTLGALLQYEWGFISTLAAGGLDEVSKPIFYVWLLVVMSFGGGMLHAHRRARHARHRRFLAHLHASGEWPALSPRAGAKHDAEGSTRDQRDVQASRG